MSSSQSDCPFCPDNGLLADRIIAYSKHGYLAYNKFNPGCYLIIPRSHIEDLSQLPSSWWQDMTELLAQVPGLDAHYNVSINIGRRAGQTVKHLHFWVIPRPADHPASGKGLAKLIAEAKADG